MRRLLIALLFSTSLVVGCQSTTSVVPQGPNGAIVVNGVNYSANSWMGFCRPVLNERGEVEVSKNSENSLRSDWEVTSETEVAWSELTFKDDDCKTPFGATKYSIKCETTQPNENGYRACKISKVEVAGFQKNEIDSLNKTKACGRNNWKLDEWQDITGTKCGEQKDFLFKFTPETDRATLEVQSDPTKIQTTKLKRKPTT